MVAPTSAEMLMLSPRSAEILEVSPKSAEMLVVSLKSAEMLMVSPTSAEMLEVASSEMLEVFPALADVDITHCWSGYVAYPRDSLPHIGREGRIFFSMGYAGSGVARASHAGHQVALQMLGQSDHLTAWNALRFDPMPFRAFARLGVRIATNWKRLQDTRS